MSSHKVSDVFRSQVFYSIDRLSHWGREDT